jgi:hypothetical protein
VPPWWPGPGDREALAVGDLAAVVDLAAGIQRRHRGRRRAGEPRADVDLAAVGEVLAATELAAVVELARWPVRSPRSVRPRRAVELAGDRAVVTGPGRSRSWPWSSWRPWSSCWPSSTSRAVLAAIVAVVGPVASPTRGEQLAERGGQLDRGQASPTMAKVSGPMAAGFPPKPRSASGDPASGSSFWPGSQNHGRAGPVLRRLARRQLGQAVSEDLLQLGRAAALEKLRHPAPVMALVVEHVIAGADRVDVMG